MSKIKVNSIEAATGSTVTLPSGQTLDLSSGTVTLPNSSVNLTTKVTGTLPVANGGTGLTTLGSASQVLRVNSGATALEFATPAVASSDFVLLATVDASSSASVSFDGYFSATYKNYKMIFSGVRMGTTNTEFRARLRTSNADITSSIYKNNNFFSQLNQDGSGANNGDYGTWNATSFFLQRGTNNGATYEGAGEATIYNPLSTTAYKQIKIEMQYIWQDLTYHFFQLQFGQCDTTSALSGISFYPVSGNITSGTFKLYGIK
jgi:hypothetical protein